MNESHQQAGSGVTARVKLGKLCRTAGMALVIACCVPWTAAAQTYYFDGSAKRIITLQSGLQAVFNDSNTAKARTTDATVRQPLISDKFVQIYRTSTAATRSASASVAGSSPVFREGTSPAGRLMALPGGVIVQFRNEWTTAQIDAWITSHAYTVRQELNIMGQWYVLDSPAGLASLEMANAIHASGDVISATPNWWIHTVPK